MSKQTNIRTVKIAAHYCLHHFKNLKLKKMYTNYSPSTLIQRHATNFEMQSNQTSQSCSSLLRSHVILFKARLLCRVIKSLSLNLSTLLTTLSGDPEKAGSALFT